MRSALRDLRARGGRRLVLDLSPLCYMDSTGLGVLIAFQRTLPPDHRIALAEPQLGLSALLRLTGLTDTFNVFSRFNDALSYVGAPGIP